MNLFVRKRYVLVKINKNLSKIVRGIFTMRPSKFHSKVDTCTSITPTLKKNFQLRKNTTKSFGNTAKIGIILLVGILGRSNNLYASVGKIGISNHIYDYSFCGMSYNIVHAPGGTEGFGQYDHQYGAMFCPDGKNTKIVTIIPGYELLNDGRPTDSVTPVNIELSIHTQWGGPFPFSNMKNELHCEFPRAGEPYFWTFGNKPITLWKRDPNDPNALYFMADIREGIAKQGGVGIIPLPDLNGTYASQVPYGWYQVRFDTFSGDFNLNGMVDLEDFSLISQDWMKTDVNSVADISGPDGIPDKKIDVFDLSLYISNYLKDSNDPNTWGRVPPPFPCKAGNPSPPDGGTDVTIDVDLKWSAGARSTSHDVYFGATYTPPFTGNQTSTTFDPGILSPNTTYYWRIDEINEQGKTTGELWGFTTGPVNSLHSQTSNPNPPDGETIVAGDINSDYVVNFKDFALMAFYWLEER